MTASRWIAWARWPFGIGLLIAFALHEGFADLSRAFRMAGPAMIWLVPFHALPLLLDAYGWRLLLDRLASLSVLWRIAMVRESVSRLLPVASIGGEVVGIRLAHWYVADINRVSASVMVEVLVTIAVQYAFSALGLVLIVASTRTFAGVHLIGFALLMSMPVPALLFVLMTRGGIFHALERFAARWLGDAHPLLSKLDGAALDREVDALMTRPGLLARVFAWQFAGYALGSLEVYWVLNHFGYLTSFGTAITIEAMIQAVRHAAFFMPAGLGVQEAAIVVLAQMTGLGQEAGILLALVKRMREVLFGCIALGGWQIAEARHNARARLKPVTVREPASQGTR